MKRTKSEKEIAASKAARKRGLFVAAIAVLIGGLMLALSGDFLALHCVVAAAVALAGGIAAARAGLPFHPDCARSAGATGGIYAALAYAPFCHAIHQVATLKQLADAIDHLFQAG